MQQTVFQRGPNAARGSLGPQCQALSIAVLKGVHLLLDDVGHLADRALEQLRQFQQRHADFAIPVSRQYVGHATLQKLPYRRPIRQHVVHAADRLNVLSH